VVARWVAVGAATLAIAGCGGDNLDKTPKKLDGSDSHNFEPDDLERAKDASDKVKEYCSKAVSDAQRIGCESHVTEDEIP
jgi:hypothetical protein